MQQSIAYSQILEAPLSGYAVPFVTPVVHADRYHRCEMALAWAGSEPGQLDGSGQPSGPGRLDEPGQLDGSGRLGETVFSPAFRFPTRAEASSAMQKISDKGGILLHPLHRIAEATP
jgi:hypothetical protein